MSKFFTAVFKITDEDKFRDFSKSITGAMAGGVQIPGCEVTGAGWCDAMTESDVFREWIDSNGGDSDAILDGDA